MPYTDLDMIAVHLQKNALEDFTSHEQAFLSMILNAVEAAISQHFVDLNGSGTITEFLPVRGRNFDDSLDMMDVDINAGRITPEQTGFGTDKLFLSKTPVLLTGLVVHEKRSRKAIRLRGARIGFRSGRFVDARRRLLSRHQFDGTQFNRNIASC
jgi:hypothetical protein